MKNFLPLEQRRENFKKFILEKLPVHALDNIKNLKERIILPFKNSQIKILGKN